MPTADGNALYLVLQPKSSIQGGRAGLHTHPPSLMVNTPLREPLLQSNPYLAMSQSTSSELMLCAHPAHLLSFGLEELRFKMTID